MSDKIDPFSGIGNEALFEIAADLQVQLERGTARGMRPVLWLLIAQRKKASEAISKLIDVDACEQEAIRSLQNEVRLYGDLVESCRALLSAGREADSEIAEKDRSEMSEIIGRMSPEEQQLYRVHSGEDD